MKTIEFYSKNNYGKELYYPVDPDFYHAHGILTKRETISDQDFKAYEILGLKFKLVLKPSKEFKS